MCVSSEMRSFKGVEPPCPVLELVRSRIGRSELVAAWRRAVILRDCMGSTLGSFSPVVNRTADSRAASASDRSTGETVGLPDAK